VSEGEDDLAALADTLDHLARLLEAGRDNYDTNQATRLALQRLWIAAGECARRYCNTTGIDVGAEPWSSLWAYRNFLAHHLPAEIQRRTSLGRIRPGPRRASGDRYSRAALSIQTPARGPCPIRRGAKVDF
jgi:hypothetical protein